MKEIYDRDGFSEACAVARDVKEQEPREKQAVEDIRLEHES